MCAAAARARAARPELARAPAVLPHGRGARRDPRRPLHRAVRRRAVRADRGRRGAAPLAPPAATRTSGSCSRPPIPRTSTASRTRSPRAPVPNRRLAFRNGAAVAARAGGNAVEWLAELDAAAPAPGRAAADGRQPAARAARGRFLVAVDGAAVTNSTGIVIHDTGWQLSGGITRIARSRETLVSFDQNTLDSLKIDRDAPSRPVLRRSRLDRRARARGCRGRRAARTGSCASSPSRSSSRRPSRRRPRSGGAPAGAAVLNASGYVVARREATVSAKVTGKIAAVLIEEGMIVEEGQLLAQLDDQTLRPQLDLAEDAARSQRAPSSTRSSCAAPKPSASCAGSSGCEPRI